MRVILSVSMIVVGSFLLFLTSDQLGRNGNGIMHIIALGMCFLAIIVVRKRRVSLKTTILKDKKVLLGIVFSLLMFFIGAVLLFHHTRYWHFWGIGSMLVLSISLDRVERLLQNISEQ
ncbi:hypothetical protein [Cytobacillus kochii]|uniref:hypothetical protein n=1 Tax=Cytobacillus kochii TaxID=859143 RepID=UPI0025A22141|nr:hypothetical protein [Cytobacillus kochii]MDM5206410.1 hypothetical protein [Cytobacillus kochii]